MKYCYHCNRVTVGEPLFCNFCGRSYNVKLCPRLHTNPRNAEVCSQCGSREFSTPQPKMTFWARVLVVTVTFLLGVALLYFSLLFVAISLAQILSSADVQSLLGCLALIIALLWWIWLQIPQWFRKTIHRLLQRRSNKRRGE